MHAKGSCATATSQTLRERADILSLSFGDLHTVGGHILRES
jgi:hypothetical protein